MPHRVVLIVSYEAGAAELLSAWARSYPNKEELQFCLDGPARTIFSRKIPFVIQNQDLGAISRLNPRKDLVLTGSSWTPDLERRAIAAARRHGVRCATFLDHWTNYRERFGTLAEWKSKLPDEIWVGDDYAYSIAESLGFPKQMLIRQENLYFAEIKEQLAHIAKHSSDTLPQGKRRLLYISEPVSDDVEKRYGRKDFWGYTEFSLMEQFVDELIHLESVLSDVCIRLHPNQHRETYDQQLTAYRGPIRLFKSTNQTILADCVWSDLVVGIESMGLVVGLLAGKKVFSCIPVGGKPCSLPHREIIRVDAFRNILNWI